MAKSNRLSYLLTIVIFLTVVFVIYNLMNESQIKVPNLKINVPEARSRRFGLIIDVRTPKERELLGYYPNSIPIAVEQLDKQVPYDISNKNTWILVYSNADNRAESGANILYKLGYPNVRYITESYLSLLPGSSY